MENVYLDYINSEFRDFRGRWVRDDLLDAQWREQFLLKWGLQVDSSPDTTTIDALIALRTLLQHAMEFVVHSGHITESDLTALNTILLNVPTHRHLIQDEQAFGLETVPLKKDWNWIQAEIIASFGELLASSDLKRLRICENKYCRQVFYDETKSRTQRYCTTDKCANLWKVRRHRARQKEKV